MHACFGSFAPHSLAFASHFEAQSAVVTGAEPDVPELPEAPEDPGVEEVDELHAERAKPRADNQTRAERVP